MNESMACVYVLNSTKRISRTYVGSTHKNNPAPRIQAHNAGKVRSTKAYIPWNLVAVEQYDTYTEARKRELFLKSGVGKKWLKNNVIKKLDSNAERCRSGRTGLS